MDKVTKFLLDKPKPFLKAKKTSAQSISTTPTYLTFDSVDIVGNSYFTVNSAGDTITINKSGRYRIDAHCGYSGDTTGTWRLLSVEISSITSNEWPNDHRNPTDNSGYGDRLKTNGTFELIKGTTIKVKTTHSATSSINTTSYQVKLDILKVG